MTEMGKHKNHLQNNKKSDSLSTDCILKSNHLGVVITGKQTLILQRSKNLPGPYEG